MTSKKFSGSARRTTGYLACLVALTVTAACTGGSDETPSSPSSAPSTPSRASSTAPPPVPLTVQVAQVSGRVAKPRRLLVRRAVGRTISAYFDAAFLKGDYPRSDFRDAFGSFSAGAARRARSDRDLLTNTDLGRSSDSVVARQQKASLSVLAPRGSVAGVTARVRLVMLADRGDAGNVRVTVGGRLLLTRKESGGWEIFGYDMTRSAVPVKGADR